MNTPQEIKIRLTSAHREWLSHPVTIQALGLLKERHNMFKKTLQENILNKSDEKMESDLRSCMRSCEAVFLILSESETFVEKLTTPAK